MLKPEIIQTPQDLLDFHASCAARGAELITTKNHDYAGYAAQGEHPDVMANFRDDGEYGICVRMGDKLRRLKNFFRSGKILVKDEAIWDTAIDLMNYAILLIAYGRTRSLRSSEKIYVVQDTLTSRFLPLDEDGCPDCNPPNDPESWPWLKTFDGVKVVAVMPLDSQARRVQFGCGNPRRKDAPKG